MCRPTISSLSSICLSTADRIEEELLDTSRPVVGVFIEFIVGRAQGALASVLSISETLPNLVPRVHPIFSQLPAFIPGDGTVSSESSTGSLTWVEID